MEKIITYKGFDKDFKCRGMQYEVGKTYNVGGNIEACSWGFHACKEAKHVLQHYPPNSSRYAIVEQFGEFSTRGDDNKVASSSITVVKEISLQEFIRVIISQQGESAASSTGDHGAASSTGYCGAASSTGAGGAASSTGYCGAASSTGAGGAASSTGYHGKVMGTMGNALFLTERNSEKVIISVWAGIVGKDGIKPNVWYSLKDGVPTEVECTP